MFEAANSAKNIREKMSFFPSLGSSSFRGDSPSVYKHQREHNRFVCKSGHFLLPLNTLHWVKSEDIFWISGGQLDQLDVHG